MIAKTVRIQKIIHGKRAKIEIGTNCYIGDMAFVALKHLIMENNSQIGPHAILSGHGKVVLKQYSVIGFGAQVITATDTPMGEFMCDFSPPDKRIVIRGSITLERGAYIGSGAMICVSKRDNNIVIGENSVIGALSYIDRSVPPETVVIPKQNLVYKERNDYVKDTD